MKKIFFWGLMAMTAGLLSCTRETPDASGLLRLYIDGSEESKVSVVDQKTVWNAGDRVAVFLESGEKQEWNYDGADKSTSGSLTRQGDKMPSGRKVAMFPYDKSSSISGNVIKTSIKSTQTFPGGDPVLVACSENDHLSFKYATSYVRVRCTGAAKYVKFVLRACGGESLAGSVSLDVSGEKPRITTASSGRAVVMNASNISGITEMYFAIPSGTYSQGFELEAAVGTDNVFASRNTLSRTLEPGQVLTMNIEVNDYDIISVNCQDSLAQDKSHPIVLGDLFPTGTKMADKGTIDKVMKYDFLTGYEFEIWSKTGFCKSTSGGGAIILDLNLGYHGTVSDVEYGGKGYSYIKLPRISGKRLVGIDIQLRSPASGNTLNVSSRLNTDNSGRGDIAPSRPVTTLVSFNLQNTEFYTSYYLCTGLQSNTRIISMDLKYSEL